MYRKPGSQSALQGVPSGPYAARRVVVEASRLGPGARRRLDDALSGRAEPSPIAYERPRGLATSTLPTWGIASGVFAIATWFAIGFDDPASGWALQPPIALVLYGAAAMVFALSLFATLKRRALLGGGALRPGRYLLPLDVVDVALPDERGRQRVTITPLGSARDAKIARDGRQTELVLTFEDGSRELFPLRGDPSGDVALRRLEHSQRLLEELTYAGGIERAFSQDPLFDMRHDGAWSGKDGEREARRGGGALLLGSRAPVYAVALGILLGAGVFSLRNAVGDRALFARALRERTPEALDAYLARGGARRSEAERVRDALLRAREDAAREAASSASAGRAEGGEPAASSRDACLAAIAARAPRSRPEARRLLESILDRSEDHVVPMRFTRTIVRPPAAVAPSLEPHLEKRERALAWAFERVFSETCPASVIAFAIREPARGSPGLDVATEVSWPRADAPVHAMTVVFDVALTGAPGSRATFRLTMPPLPEPPKAPRPKSLFVVTAPPATDARALDLMTARAYDRLYDEIHGLFFDGDPRVPLHADAR